MRCAAVPHEPRRLPVTGPPSAAARLWMKTATACATMPKTVHEPTVPVPGSTLPLGLATAMDAVAALAVLLARAHIMVGAAGAGSAAA